jgi:hypothetical protein
MAGFRFPRNRITIIINGQRGIPADTGVKGRSNSGRRRATRRLRARSTRVSFLLDANLASSLRRTGHLEPRALRWPAQFVDELYFARARPDSVPELPTSADFRSRCSFWMNRVEALPEP